MENPQKQSPTLLKSMAERLSRFFRKEASSPDEEQETQTKDVLSAPTLAQNTASTEAIAPTSNEPRRRRTPKFDDSQFERSVTELSSAEARALIEQHVEKHLGDVEFDVVKMANNLGTSRTNLYLVMRREYDMTPAGFIMNRRIRHAVALLDSGATVREACFKCGFADPKYFSKVFRKYCGMLPSQYIEKKD